MQCAHTPVKCDKSPYYKNESLVKCMARKELLSLFPIDFTAICHFLDYLAMAFKASIYYPPATFTLISSGVLIYFIIATAEYIPCCLNTQIYYKLQKIQDIPCLQEYAAFSNSCIFQPNTTQSNTA